MAEVVFKLESILSQEREIANSVVDEERFVYKLRSLFTRKDDAAIESEFDSNMHHASILIEDDDAIGRNEDERIRTFTYAELESATNSFMELVYSPALNEYIFEGWVDERTYAPTERGVGLAMYVTKMSVVTWKRPIKLKRFNHPNLVKLLGYCLNIDDLFCVYEDISGITLDEYLCGEAGTPSLSWVARLNIAIGAAEGLLYLHKKKQPAYSQFKTNFILVDMDFNARLSDFVFEPHTFELNQYYAAPEWFHYHRKSFEGRFLWRPPEDRTFIFKDFAVKSEIYALGVVLLEILTGIMVYDERRPFGKEIFLEWAIPLLPNEVNLGMIMDPQLQHNDCPPKGAFHLAQLISNCLQLQPAKRPSMEEILEALRHCYQEEIKTV